MSQPRLDRLFQTPHRRPVRSVAFGLALHANGHRFIAILFLLLEARFDHNFSRVRSLAGTDHVFLQEWLEDVEVGSQGRTFVFPARRAALAAVPAAATLARFAPD